MEAMKPLLLVQTIPFSGKHSFKLKPFLLVEAIFLLVEAIPFNGSYSF